MAQFPLLTNAQVLAKDFMNQGDTVKALDLLQNLPYVNVSAALAAGATGVTTNEHIFVAPCKLEILEAKFITTAVNTGTSNEPEVKLLAGTDIVGVSGAIVLAGAAVGDVATLTLDAAEVVIAAGTKLILRIVNPTATITTPLTGKLQFIWKPTV